MSRECLPRAGCRLASHFYRIFYYDTDLTEKNRTGDEVTSYYVSSPFYHSISLVDLKVSAVTSVYMCCTAIPDKCHRPSYLTVTDRGNLMATVGYGIILVNTTNGHVELLTNPDGLQRNRPELDGPFGFAQVGELGPISKHPGTGGKIFVFADRLLRNLRVMDLSTRRFYSLCAPGTKDFITRYSTEPTPALQISGGQMPICMLSVPHTVLVTHSSQALLVSQSDRLENLYIKCKY